MRFKTYAFFLILFFHVIFFLLTVRLPSDFPVKKKKHITMSPRLCTAPPKKLQKEEEKTFEDLKVSAALLCKRTWTQHRNPNTVFFVPRVLLLCSCVPFPSPPLLLWLICRFQIATFPPSNSCWNSRSNSWFVLRHKQQQLTQ